MFWNKMEMKATTFVVNWITMTRKSGKHLYTTYGTTGLISSVYRDLDSAGVLEIE